MLDGYYYCLNCHSEITPDHNEHCPFCGITAVAVAGDYSNEEVETAFDLLNKQQQGLIIVPPCKVGDTVYSLQIDMRFDAVITEIRITDTDIFFEWVQYDKSVEITELWDEGYFVLEDFGKTVFLTREGAEKALEEHTNAND